MPVVDIYSSFSQRYNRNICIPTWIRAGNLLYVLRQGSEKVELILQKGLLYTPPSTCQAHLKIRTSHIITGYVVASKPWVSLCNFASPMRSLTPKMKKGFRLLYQSGCDCPVSSINILYCIE